VCRCAQPTGYWLPTLQVEEGRSQLCDREARLGVGGEISAFLFFTRSVKAAEDCTHSKTLARASIGRRLLGVASDGGDWSPKYDIIMSGRCLVDGLFLSVDA
jgi:hypothetical protein